MAEHSLSTRMFVEASEAGPTLQREEERIKAAATVAAAAFAALKPPFLAACARGSSACAATYAKSLIETRLQVPVLAQSHVLASVLGLASPGLGKAAMIAMSQSGRSEDLLLSADAAQSAGAVLISLVNDEGSPLAAKADVLIPLCAGAERSVAATKSFIPDARSASGPGGRMGGRRRFARRRPQAAGCAQLRMAPGLVAGRGTNRGRAEPLRPWSRPHSLRSAGDGAGS